MRYNIVKIFGFKKVNGVRFDDGENLNLFTQKPLTLNNRLKNC